jgi:hypothetical protein
LWSDGSRRTPFRSPYGDALTHDDIEAGPSGMVKDESADPGGKQEIVNKGDYNFF